MFGFGSKEKTSFMPEGSVIVLNEHASHLLDKAPEPTIRNLKEIELQDDLPIFTEKLYDVIHMPPSTRHLVCPIALSTASDGKPRFALITLKEEFDSDVSKEVSKALALKGYIKSDPFQYIATSVIMSELARDSINENKKSASKQNVSFLGRKANSALWRMFENVVAFAVINDASDIHFEIDRSKSTSHIRFRIDGRLASPAQFKLNTNDVLDTMAYLYNVHGNSGSQNTYNENKPQQCQIQATINSRKLLFRWASNQTAKGTKVVLRMLYQDEVTTMRSLADLGYLPMQIEMWKRAIMRLGGGTVLSGVVGSGKSTTMQTIMSMLPDWMSRYTVEDPVEYIMPGTSQFSVSRSLGDEGDSKVSPFLAVMRQLKRMDPDAVLVGEIRDKESAALFRDIAESGHRAFATLHAPSAIDMITLRLVSEEIGIPKGVIATPGFMNLLVYQALVPKLCPHCNLPGEHVHNDDYLTRIERLFKISRKVIKAKNAAGCPACRRDSLPELNGSRGRLVVAEMIELDSIMLGMFRDGLNMELKEYVRMTRGSNGFDNPDSTGKSALEVAMYHVSQGVFDPIDVEQKFGSFEQYENEFRK